MLKALFRRVRGLFCSAPQWDGWEWELAPYSFQTDWFLGSEELPMSSPPLDRFIPVAKYGRGVTPREHIDGS